MNQQQFHHPNSNEISRNINDNDSYTSRTDHHRTPSTNMNTLVNDNPSSDTRKSKLNVFITSNPQIRHNQTNHHISWNSSPSKVVNLNKYSTSDSPDHINSKYQYHRDNQEVEDEYDYGWDNSTSDDDNDGISTISNMSFVNKLMTLQQHNNHKGLKKNIL